MSGFVSVIVPCFNDGQYLREAVESVWRCHDGIACELIVVNDGSTDVQTVELLAALEREGCHVIHQPNRGLGAARNAGIKASKGSYVLPLDSDNRIRPDYISAGLRVLESHPRIGVAYGDAEYFGVKTGRWHVAEFSLSRLIQGNYIDACALFRRAAWEEVGGYDEKMPVMGWEDWDFWLRLSFRNWGFCHLNAVMFDYRVREDSMISRTSRHVGELTNHIFSKEELGDAKLVRQRQQEIERLLALERSLDYKLGRAVLNPLRRVRRLIKRTPPPTSSATLSPE